MHSRSATAAAARRPNVLLIMTDDQGFGDLGAHGNPKIKTPHLDAFTRESVWLKNFYVSPVCAPTRASLLTGRYNFRTGVVDTYLGRALMYPDEVTLAEVLSGAGYRTGIFGKWHLGDNAPMRPIDQGFQEALVIEGRRDRPGLRPAGRQQLFRPDPSAQRRPGALQGLLQRHLRRRRDRFHEERGRPPFLRLSGLQLPSRAARSERGRAGPIQGDGPVARVVPQARPADSARMGVSPGEGRTRVCDGLEHRYERRTGAQGSCRIPSSRTTRSSSS